MDSSFAVWLDQVGSLAIAWSLGLFIAVNAVAAWFFFARRDRELVNKWTSRVLAIDLLLIGSGVGIPVAASLAKFAVAELTTQVSASALVREK